VDSKSAYQFLFVIFYQEPTFHPHPEVTVHSNVLRRASPSLTFMYSPIPIR
jgi:hypothetical protein